MAGEEQVLHMNGGSGETSYANNSILQRKVIQMAQPVLEDSLTKMHNDHKNSSFPRCFRIADLGCASGPNALFVASKIVDIVHGLCLQRDDHEQPEFHIYLNDLPDNDFNSIFKSVPAFIEHSLHKIFVSGVPGSFYGRLFPRSSLHFVHSSYSIHWLSQVPKLLENNGNIYIGKSSPPNVHKAYWTQFQRDFSTFLGFRSEEIIQGGRMVLTFIGRSIADATSKDCRYVFELLSKSLLELVAEGLIKESDVDSFHLPFYTPCKEEVIAIIHKQGSFTLDKLEVFRVNWDASDDDFDDKHVAFDNYGSGKNVARSIRAVMEPILASHFGDSIIDNLFAKYAKNVAQHLLVEKTKYFNMVISLVKN